MNIRMILYFLGWILRVEAVCLLPSVVIAFFQREETLIPCLGVGLGAFLIGTAMSLRKPGKTDFYTREGFVSVAFGWILLSVIGALPFYLSGRIPHYIDALFEIVSGFTTTGSSVLAKAEDLGPALLFWRSFSHWIGGMGVLVLVLTVLPMAGGYHMLLMKAEAPGPSVSKLLPKVADTAKELYKIYIGMTVLMIVVYLLSGMPLFDALCIGFGTAGTGGFAVRNSGMADYSRLSQLLITIFMILFGINFNVYYLMLRRKWHDALACEEVRVYLGIIAAVTLVIALNILPQMGSLIPALHHSFFTVGSIITTTGFATEDFNTWPQLSQLLLLGLMFCGACAGSTGGGIKVSRLIIFVRQMAKELHIIIHPQAVRIVKMENKRVEHAILRSVDAFLLLYISIFCLSLLVISLDNFDFSTNFSAVAATINNIGPGLSLVGPYANFSQFSDLSKLVLIFDMLAGRLELLPMLVLFSVNTWRGYNR